LNFCPLDNSSCVLAEKAIHFWLNFWHWCWIYWLFACKNWQAFTHVLSMFLLHLCSSGCLRLLLKVLVPQFAVTWISYIRKIFQCVLVIVLLHMCRMAVWELTLPLDLATPIYYKREIFRQSDDTISCFFMYTVNHKKTWHFIFDCNWLIFIIFILF